MPQTKLSRSQIESILNEISFMDRTFLLLDKGDGYLLQMEYYEPDVTQPGSAAVRQSTRKYYISPFMSESEIVEAAWLCVQRSQLHVASEHFTYKKARVYSQHFHIEGRLYLAHGKIFDNRQPIKDKE